MASRIAQLRAGLKARKLDGIIVSYLPHVRYLCGFSGSAGQLLVTASDAVFFTDFRYEGQIAEELHSGVRGLIERDPHKRMLADKLVVPGMAIGYQDQHATVSAYEQWKASLKRVRLVPVGSFVAELVMVKTPDEIARIKKAADIAGKVYRQILTIAAPGVRENELAMEISYLGRKFGADGDAFDIIVASGPRGALPHGRFSTRKIRKGELVTLDFGFSYKGLNSDMTRTFAVGEPNSEARKIYSIVLEAQMKGVAAARAGITGKALDAACRDVIAAAGYGAQFGHSTGHGLGIDVHELPRVAATNTDDKLKAGSVVTIEPGIYIPGRCGVRIEDDVVLTATGCTVLTRAPKKLIIV